MTNLDKIKVLVRSVPEREKRVAATSCPTLLRIYDELPFVVDELLKMMGTLDHSRECFRRRFLGGKNTKCSCVLSMIKELKSC